MKMVKDEGYEEDDRFMLLESGDNWLRIQITKGRVEIDKFGNVSLTPPQAIRLAKKILRFYKE